MRKEIVLPAATVAVGAAGFLLRRWELATAFEPDTGLHIPGSPATWALIALSAALAAALVLLCRGKYPDFAGGYDQAFQAKGNTLYATAMILSAFLLLAAAGGMVLSFLRRENTVVTRLILAALCVASFACVVATTRNNFRGEGKGKYNFTLLMPAYTGCVWLIAAYQVRAGDPVQLDYIYELFAIIAVLLGLYFNAGFSFERGKPFPGRPVLPAGGLFLPGHPGGRPRPGDHAAVRLCRCLSALIHRGPAAQCGPAAGSAYGPAGGGKSRRRGRNGGNA